MFRPDSVSAARYASLIRPKSPQGVYGVPQSGTHI
ncbi:hypothetical protein [Enterocloster sp.]